MQVDPVHVDYLTQLISGGIAAIPGGAVAIVLLIALKSQTTALVGLAQDFKEIVIANTTAVTQNTDAIKTSCRYKG